MPPAQPACPGFKFAGVIAGIKQSGRPDLGLIVAEDDVPAAAVFTKNRVRAAPVELSEANVKSGVARAIIVNSGNANACTGDKGVFDAAAMAEYAARAIGCDKKRVLVASTGVIGQPLPIERIVAATPRLHAAARPDGLDDFVHAIMTTDRFEKRALHLVPLGPKTRARVVGVAKGAGMIAPNMATTLAFLTTDAAVSKTFLRTVLREEVEATFNAVSVDGDTSTNDMVAIMASGAAKNKPIDGGDKGKAFRQAVHDVLDELSRQIVRDGEGATHVVTIEVAGAENAAAAEHGGAPHRARRRCARRPSSAPIPTGAASSPPSATPASTSTRARSTSPSARSRSCRAGVGVGAEAERHAHEVMRRGEYTIRVHLNRGRAQGRHVTCDLTVDYVKLNADYRT